MTYVFYPFESGKNILQIHNYFFLLTVFSRTAKEGLHFLLCLVLLVCFLLFHGIMSNLARPETRGPGALLEQIVILLDSTLEQSAATS